MTQAEYNAIEAYMRRIMWYSAHDTQHIYRVLYRALDIAAAQPKPVNTDVLIAACLLHDIGRANQAENPAVCHAEAGAIKAHKWLISKGWSEAFAEDVASCVRSHRFRSQHPPATIEAKILFDADKLDATGAIGIARTLLYGGEIAQPLYTVNKQGTPLDGSSDEPPSFLREYHFKLKELAGTLHTARAKEIAVGHLSASRQFYKALWGEIEACYQSGEQNLATALESAEAE